MIIGGGGDSVAAIPKSGFAGRITYISICGKAFLEFLEGGIIVASGRRSANFESVSGLVDLPTIQSAINSSLVPEKCS